MLEIQFPVLFALSVAATLIVQKLTSEKGFASTYKRPRIRELWIYPIKSCKGFKVNQATVTKRGLEFDRLFMVVDSSDGKFVSQRKFPRMALIVTAINYDERTLELDAPGMPRLIVPLDETESEEMTVTVWGDSCQASKVGGLSACEWFNAFLNTNNLQLVRMKDDYVRPTDPEYAPEGQTGFADGFPFLLASIGSLDVLNKKLLEPVTMERFRPNIIVENCSPYAEDGWKQIKFLNEMEPLITNVVKPCSRCTIPNIDPNMGSFTPDGQPSKVMKTFRTGKALNLGKAKWDGQLFFGQNLDHQSQEGQVLQVGDEIEIMK